VRTWSMIFMVVVVMAMSGLAAPVQSSGDAALSTGPADFRILTHNLYTVLGAPGIDRRIDLVSASDYIGGYDALILNELFNDEASARLVQALSAEYPFWTPVIGREGTLITPDCAANDCWNSADGRFDEVEDGGTAIFSRWPIRERRQIMFDTSCDMDGYANKGFVYVRLDVRGTPVHVVGTHMQADASNLGPLGQQIAALRPCPAPEEYPHSVTCPGESETPYQAVRLAQLMQINTWITQQAIPADQMVIIGGDLNVDSVGTPAEYERMLCVLDVSAPTFGGNPAISPPRYTWDTRLNGLLLSSTDRPLYIDYLLVRRDHLQPTAWYNDVIYASPFPVSWDSGYARGYEYSDHFPAAGYSDPADAPDPITTRINLCAPGGRACDKATCPDGFTAAAEGLCYRRAD
jgi:endonuclease/exonuclease/phosphatase family metal-dependent hydrolase